MSTSYLKGTQLRNIVSYLKDLKEIQYLLSSGKEKDVISKYSFEYSRALTTLDNINISSIIGQIEDLSEQSSMFDMIRLTLFRNKNPYEEPEVAETLFEKATRLHDSDPDVQLVSKALARKLSFQELINIEKVTEEEINNDPEIQTLTEAYYLRWRDDEYTCMKGDLIKRNDEEDLPF